ncbi:unnamed protein product [Colias eurytheme]|nr:unnamed protein product [Colias eurytheme]
METNINNLNVCCVTNLDINVDNGEIKADQSRNKNETKPHSKVIFKLVNYKHILGKNKLEDNLVIKKYDVNYKRRLKRNAQDIYNRKYAHLHTTYFDTTVDPVNDLSETENTITDFDVTTDASVIKDTNLTEDNDSIVASDTKDSTSYLELDPSTNLYSSESTTDPSIATDIDTTTQQLEYTDIDSTTYSPTDADPSTSSETDSPANSQSTYVSTDGDLTQEPSTVNPTTVIYDDYDDGDGDDKRRVSWSPWTIGLVVLASTVVVSILAVSTYHLGKISERSKEFFSEDLEPPNIVVIPRARLNRY